MDFRTVCLLVARHWFMHFPARPLQRILTQVFWVVITNYLDDYVPFSDISEKVIRTVFHVLGFVLSTNPKKDHPFAETFTVLGVEFLLHDTPTSLAVRNTAARCEELLALLHEILHSDCVTARQLQSLRSRLHFAEAHMYGQVGVCMIKQMSVMDGFAQTSPLPPALRVSIHPPEVPMLQKEPWHVFTDGAQEGDNDQARTSIGAVVISSDGRCRALAFWPPRHILHAELLPVLVALAAWGERPRSTRCGAPSAPGRSCPRGRPASSARASARCATRRTLAPPRRRCRGASSRGAAWRQSRRTPPPRSAAAARPAAGARRAACPRRRFAARPPRRACSSGRTCTCLCAALKFPGAPVPWKQCYFQQSR